MIGEEVPIFIFDRHERKQNKGTSFAGEAGLCPSGEHAGNVPIISSTTSRLSFPSTFKYQIPLSYKTEQVLRDPTAK